jgi:hypothetical protein
MIGELQPQQIEEVLGSQVVGRIGCHASGETYIVPISYAYDGTYIYCHTHEGKKLDMMRQNPKICFEVDDLKDMANWKSVIAKGTFQELIGRHERNNAMQMLLNRYLPVMSSITTHLESSGLSYRMIQERSKVSCSVLLLKKKAEDLNRLMSHQKFPIKLIL